MIFFVKSLFLKKVSAPFFDPNVHFQKDWAFFSEGVRSSDFFYMKSMSLKFMGKLTAFKKIASASRNLETSIFPRDFCGPVCTHLPQPREFV